MAPQSCLSRLPEGPSIVSTDAPHCTLTSWVCWSISADVTRGAEDLCECIRDLVEVLSQVSVSTSVRDVSVQDQISPAPQVLEANVEAGAFVWTVYEVTDRRAPGAVHKY